MRSRRTAGQRLLQWRQAPGPVRVYFSARSGLRRLLSIPGQSHQEQRMAGPDLEPTTQINTGTDSPPCFSSILDRGACGSRSLSDADLGLDRTRLQYSLSDYHSLMNTLTMLTSVRATNSETSLRARIRALFAKARSFLLHKNEQRDGRWAANAPRPWDFLCCAWRNDLLRGGSIRRLGPVSSRMVGSG